MHAAPRLQCAIELLDAIIAAARTGGAAADAVAARFFRERRYAGAGDRRAIRALTWSAIRRFGERPVSGRAAMLAMADKDAELAALFSGEGKAPAAIVRGEPRAGGGLVPAWLLPRLDPRINEDEIVALLERAPLDLRINRLRAEGVVLPLGERLPAPLDGLRLPADTDISAHPAMQVGAVEVQDAGSQWIAHACSILPGQCVVDLCAGAGGKTLALASAMKAEGRLVAADVDRMRLSALVPRAERAGATCVETRLMNPGGEVEALADLAGKGDVVLVDAPCSGSGTWRRGPETRWRLTPARLERLMASQAHLLAIAAELVAPRGALVYAACSIISDEGEGQVEQFLRAHRDFRTVDIAGVGRGAGPGRLLTPHHDSTDGFFMARMERS